MSKSLPLAAERGVRGIGGRVSKVMRRLNEASLTCVLDMSALACVTKKGGRRGVNLQTCMEQSVESA